jgi:hypothetical protein
MNNPFVILCRTSATKNIDSNFVKTLEAMMFLNGKNIDSTINECYEVELLINVDRDMEKSKWFQEKLAKQTATKVEHSPYDDDYQGFRMSQPSALYNHLQSRSVGFDKEVYNIKEEIHIGSFLINRLSENFRRLYSANKNGGNVPKDLGSSIEILKEQQRNIYKSLELVAPHIKFSSETRTFNSIFFGKVRHCTESQAFFYLAMHEYLQPENESIHKKIFSTCFNIEDINPSIIKDVAMLSYPLKKSKFISSFIEDLPEQFFKEMSLYLVDKSRVNGSFMADAFMHCVKNNIVLPTEQKGIILKSLLDSHSAWGKMPVEMAGAIANEIKDYISDVPLDFIKAGLIIPNNINKNCATNVCLHLVDKLTDPDLFWAALNDHIEPQQQTTLFAKFDFSDQENLLKIARKISSGSEYNKKEKMPIFIRIVGDYMENETIAHILALDCSFIEFIQPLYMTKRLDSELKKDTDIQQNVNQSKRLKI